MRSQRKRADNMNKVYMIGTGGTISAEEKLYKNKPIWYAGTYPVDYLVAIPELEEIAEIETNNLLQMASTDMNPTHWVKMAEAIFEKINDFHGVVITHGTDTMHYTGAALSFMLQNLSKPVILTGSQTAATVIGSDAKRNIIDSVKAASDTDVAEVCIVFNGKILRANRTKKYYESGFNAFESVDMPIGFIEPNIKLTGQYTKKRQKTPVLDTKIDDRVLLLKAYPGMDPSVLRSVASHGYHGLVIEAYGAGNLPRDKNKFFPEIAKLVKKGITVAITTQCIIGSPWPSRYESGQEAAKAGAISCQDMLSETALVKLMWALGHTKNMKKIKEIMRTNYANEISTSKWTPQTGN